MTSLHEATRMTRSLLKVGGVIFVAFILIIVIVRMIFSFMVMISPKPKPQAESKFGQLNVAPFPTNTTKLFYTLNTIDGGLPRFPTMVKVYKLNKRSPTLLDVAHARDYVGGAGFMENEVKKSETVYQWTNSKAANVPITITYDIISNDFEIASNFTSIATPSANIKLPKKENAPALLLSYLGRMSVDTSDIDQGKIKAVYYKIYNNMLIPVESYNEAQLIRVDLYQTDIDKMPVMYPFLDESTMFFWLMPGKFGTTVVSGRFKHQLVTSSKEPTMTSTYQIIQSDQAFKDLSQGKALIFNKSGLSNIEITDVYLGYYSGDDIQDYLIPIVVFQGNNFKAYVHALPESSFSKTSVPQ